MTRRMTPLQTRHRTRSLRVARWLSRTVLATLGVEVRTRGALPDGPALLVANHIGWMDILAVLARVECTFIAKAEVRRWPVVGALAVRLGVIFVDRQRPRDLLRSVPATVAALAAGRRVLLFAEGTTGDGRALLPFKSALVEAAVRAAVPVVPLAIRAEAARGDASALSWIGDESLLANLPRVRRLSGAAITVHAAPALTVGPSRKPLTAAARAAIARRLPHGAVALAPPAVARPALARMAAGALRSASALLVALVLGGTLLYAVVPRYDFPRGAPFEGTCATTSRRPAAW